MLNRLKKLLLPFQILPGSNKWLGQFIIVVVAKTGFTILASLYSMQGLESYSWLFSLALTVSLASLIVWAGNQQLLEKMDRQEVLRTFRWGTGLLALMVSTMLALSYLGTLVGLGDSSNQVAVESLQNSLPAGVFLFYLCAISISEELIFRKIIYDKAPNAIIALLLTSLFFAYVHDPSHGFFFIIYAILGGFLGFMRHKTTVQGSIGLHIVWNLLVFGLSFIS